MKVLILGAFTRDHADPGGTVRVVTGDTTDPAAVERAMAGQDAVVDAISETQPYVSGDATDHATGRASTS